MVWGFNSENAPGLFSSGLGRSLSTNAMCARSAMEAIAWNGLSFKGVISMLSYNEVPVEYLGVLADASTSRGVAAADAAWAACTHGAVGAFCAQGLGSVDALR